MSDPAPPLPYRETTDESYATAAAQNFTIEQIRPGTMVLRGPCPRCSTIIDIPVVDSVLRLSLKKRNAALRSQDPAPTRHRVEPMICTCKDPHPDRPTGANGCGAYWTLTLVTGQEP
ncbi:hypothetical protein AB0B10_24925 [Micromonospora arborensis]|uniref:hypothetical protein n=1 Tax=Micromonospora arborensis TaxID=2116518 RepID=UPI00340F7055